MLLFYNALILTFYATKLYKILIFNIIVTFDISHCTLLFITHQSS